MDMDPYIVMGVPKNVTLQTLRSRYFELARLHHPDKLVNTGLCEDEIAVHEEMFKNITNAYTRIEKDIVSSSTSTFANAGDTDVDDWRSVWNHIENICKIPGVWGVMKNIVKETIKDVAVKSH
jgi:preprotein translocase subunit Sec63